MKSKYFYPIFKLKIKPWIKYWLLKNIQISPKDYTQLEYIESTGTQYIDTDVMNTGDITINITVAVNKGDDQQGIFGATGTSDNNSQLRLYTGKDGDVDKLQYGYGTSGMISYITSIAGLDTTTKTNYIFGKGVFKINGETYITYNTQTFTVAQKSTIFGVRRTDGIIGYLASMKLYSLKIYDDSNNLIRDFIPCKNPNNIVGLYDLVSQTFFTNEGEGEFIAGGIK